MRRGFPAGVDSEGGVGSKMAAILDGTHHAYVNRNAKLKSWDMGMVPNILAAGGIVTRLDGSPIDFHKPSVITDLVCSANPKLHEQMLLYVRGFKG